MTKLEAILKQIDNHRIYRVYEIIRNTDGSESQTYFMTAPMKTVREVMALAPEAALRVQTEGYDGMCRLYLNHRSPLGERIFDLEFYS